MGFLMYLFPSPEAAYIWLTSSDPDNTLKSCEALDIFLRADEVCHLSWEGCEFAYEDDGTFNCINYVCLYLQDEEPVYGWIPRDLLPFEPGLDLGYGTVVLPNEVEIKIEEEECL